MPEDLVHGKCHEEGIISPLSVGIGVVVDTYNIESQFSAGTRSL